VTGFVAGFAVGLTWLGASILILSDARRGLAVGLLTASVGLALAMAVEGRPLEGGLLLAGGVLAVVVGLRRNPQRGWGLLQGPSTPRIVLCVVLGGAALWLAVGMLQSPGQAQARAAAVIAMAVGAGRLLAEREPRSGLAAAALVALGAGALAALASDGWDGAAIGSLVAVALNLLPTAAEGELEGG
jgi:hypothetical protein